MNIDKLDKLLILLAAANITPADFRLMAAAIRDLDEDVLENRYARIRTGLRRLNDTAFTDHGTATTSPSNKSLKEEIIELAEEGAAGPADAAERLHSHLTRIDDQLVLPSYSQREGFRKWLDRVIRLTSANAVLNAAIAEFSTRAASADGWRLSDT